MDPSSSTASSSSAAAPESRPQAGPLPRKRGEIGFEERETDEARSTTPTAAMPERHPEERRSTDTQADPAPTPASPSLTTHPAGSSESISKKKRLLGTTHPAGSSESISKKKRILGFFKPKDVPLYWGLRITTLVACICQCLAVAGTIVGWYFAVSKLSHASSSSSSQPDNDNGQQSLSGSSSGIFIHVVFGVATLVQLLFIERRVFKLRAQRYSYLHPGEILPSARRRMGMGDPALALSPWNRPPLPTYAAALAQSGIGTGDVEDSVIAAAGAPPPAYGNTRGSTFLLSGFLRESLRAQRPVSAHSASSSNARHMSQRSERPLSYKSIDEDWEEVQDADRARVLEETLARLEQPAPAVIR